MGETVGDRVLRLVTHVYGKRGVAEAARRMRKHQRTLASIVPQQDGTPGVEPKLETAQYIADFFGVPLAWLATGRGPLPAILQTPATDALRSRLETDLALRLANPDALPDVDPTQTADESGRAWWRVISTLPLDKLHVLALRVLPGSSVLAGRYLSSRARRDSETAVNAERTARLTAAFAEAQQLETQAWATAVGAVVAEYGPAAVAEAWKAAGPVAWLGFTPFALYLHRTGALPADLGPRFVRHAYEIFEEMAAHANVPLPPSPFAEDGKPATPLADELTRLGGVGVTSW